MIVVPPEIWLQVARFIPDELLNSPHMMAVCRVFFELGLDARWNNVAILTSRFSQQTKILDRISDPIITRRIRRLMLFLHLEEQAIYSLEQNHESPLPRFRQNFHAIENPFKKSRRKPISSSKIKTFDDVLAAIISLSPNLCDLQELGVDCWNLPPSTQLSRFLINLWMPIHENLRVLSFGGNLHQYRILVDSKPDFQALKELRMDFNNHGLLEQSVDHVTLLEVVLPFVQTLKPQLESLRISSSANLDFSAFFKPLGPFSVLEVLDNHHDSKLIDGTEMLQRTRIPKDFALQIIPNEYLIQCFADSQHPSHLRALAIQHPATGLEIIRSFIGRGSGTLEEVYLGGRYFEFSEAETIILALAPCPNFIFLKMKAIRITAQLFKLLARNLPNLRSLSISFQEHLHWSGSYQSPFFQDLKHIQWGLKDLSLYGPFQPLDAEIMHFIALHIPSVDSFFGRGHKSLS